MANSVIKKETEKIIFRGTLGGSVMNVVRNCPVGITFYRNSNSPAGAPDGIGYGAYIIIKPGTDGISIMCIANMTSAKGFACAYEINESLTDQELSTRWAQI